VLILPSIYFAYILIEEKIPTPDWSFTDNEFSNKGIAILYKKTKFNQNPKNWSSVSYKRYSADETKSKA
jgi:hypothetical protein